MAAVTSTRILRLHTPDWLQASDFRLQVRISIGTIQCEAMLFPKPEARSLMPDA